MAKYKRYGGQENPGGKGMPKGGSIDDGYEAATQLEHASFKGVGDVIESRLNKGSNPHGGYASAKSTGGASSKSAMQ